MRHVRSILNKKIGNNDVFSADIVACLMKNGQTQHYAIVINGKGSIVGFGYYINDIEKTDVTMGTFGITFGNVKGYFEYLKAVNLSCLMTINMLCCETHIAHIVLMLKKVPLILENLI
ncbi:hypothetical protein QTP88_021674 [Uroleucon formosanum]